MKDYDSKSNEKEQDEVGITTGTNIDYVLVIEHK